MVLSDQAESSSSLWEIIPVSPQSPKTASVQPGSPDTQTYLTRVSYFCLPQGSWAQSGKVLLWILKTPYFKKKKKANHLLTPPLRGCENLLPCSSHLCLFHILSRCVAGSDSYLKAASQLLPVCFFTLDLRICGLALSLGSIMLEAGGCWKCTPPNLGSSFTRATSWMARWRARVEQSTPSTLDSALKLRAGLMQSIR